MESFSCPFCDEKIQAHLTKNETYCENMNLENNNGEYVCSNCGSVHGYDKAGE